MRSQRFLTACLLSAVPIWANATTLIPPEVDGINPQLQWSRSLMPNIQLRPRLESGGAVVPAATAPESSAVAPDRQWTILMSDKTLYRTLRRWAGEANYQLLWQVDRDYPIEVSVQFKGALRDAVEQVVAGVALTDYPIQAVFNTQARVLRVVRHMDDGRR